MTGSRSPECKAEWEKEESIQGADYPDCCLALVPCPPSPHPPRDLLLDQFHSLGSGDALGQSRVRDGMGA